VISGQVNVHREAVVALVVQGPSGQSREIEAVIDTGFTGRITLPPDLIAALSLPFRGRGSVILGDGRESAFDIFEAGVLWDGKLRQVAVDAADTEPLVGMRLLQGYELAIQVVPGGTVSIRPLFFS
jgi:clan AA aspartic protease